MKEARIELRINFGSGELKMWSKVDLPTTDHKHLEIWEAVKKTISEMKRKK